MDQTYTKKIFWNDANIVFYDATLGSGQGISLQKAKTKSFGTFQKDGFGVLFGRASYPQK